MPHTKGSGSLVRQEENTDTLAPLRSPGVVVVKFNSTVAEGATVAGVLGKSLSQVPMTVFALVCWYTSI